MLYRKTGAGVNSHFMTALSQSDSSSCQPPCALLCYYESMRIKRTREALLKSIAEETREARLAAAAAFIHAHFAEEDVEDFDDLRDNIAETFLVDPETGEYTTDSGTVQDEISRYNERTEKANEAKARAAALAALKEKYTPQQIKQMALVPGMAEEQQPERDMQREREEEQREALEETAREKKKKARPPQRKKESADVLHAASIDTPVIDKPTIEPLFRGVASINTESGIAPRREPAVTVLSFETQPYIASGRVQAPIGERSLASLFDAIRLEDPALSQQLVSAARQMNLGNYELAETMPLIPQQQRAQSMTIAV